MLNLKIRKHFLNKNISINLIGILKDFNYPINHLGISIKTLLDIVEGKHFFCKQLRKAKNPLIIIGSEFILRKDSLLIQNLIRKLAKYNYLLLNNNYLINFVHANIAQSNLCELGLNSNSNSILNLNNLKKNNEYFLINNNINDFNEKHNGFKQLLCSLNTHRFENDIKFKYNLPINSFYERNSLNVNIEGFIQKGFKSKSSLELSRNSEDIFKGIISIDKDIKKIKNQLFTKK
jgi:NADH dehydrogenase/NADH:ubiquinone oxidoreductase subunit G